jgi:hypothetical protein
MRKYLNNPRIVIPLALFVVLWVCHSYGLLDQLLPDFSDQSQSLASTQVAVEKEVFALTSSGRVMQGLVRDQWLLRSWSKSSAIKSEPFVANFSFTKNELPDGISANEVVEEVVEEVVVIDPVALDQYIVEHLGLDKMGFFVRFGSINKRQGDLLRTTGGRELILGPIAPAEERRTEAEHAATVALHLSRLQLLAVIKNALKHVISVADDFVLADLTTSEDVALSTEPSLAELTKSQGTFREGDTVNPELINRSEESQNSASAVISGGLMEHQIYRLGDFVQKNPALGLAEVHEDHVQLVDRYGKFYRLDLKD